MKTNVHFDNYLSTILGIVILELQYVFCQYSGELPNFVLDSKGGMWVFNALISFIY